MNWFFEWSRNGLLGASWWQVVLYVIIVTHITMISVTVYLHRHQTHRALDLHPIASHFFRFWLWLKTGIITRVFVAIHRKHHAMCETVDDPHSPQTRGIWTVLLTGYELYHAEAKNIETLNKYGKRTPVDWIERNLYSRFDSVGIFLTLLIDLALFGPIGLTVWAIQMAWTPIMAAGVINGIGHFWGYRNYDSPDKSTNIIPWGMLIGGEELHNNHHTYPSSAKLSVKWYEFDIGWMYICILSFFHLAIVKKVPPKIKMGSYDPVITMQTIRTIANHRYEIMARYARYVQRVYSQKIDTIEQSSEYVQLIAMRDELYQFWTRKNATVDQLIADFDSWCHRAETSQQKFLVDLSISLRSMQTH